MNRDPTPLLPLPEPLNGTVEGSFAHYTITVRMPWILREVIEENDYPPGVEAKLQALLVEIPNAPLRPLQDASAPDSAEWARYILPYLGKNWLEVPWFFAEPYYYRRILEATGYFEPGPRQGSDPFTNQKRKVLETADQAVMALSKTVAQAVQIPNLDTEQKQSWSHRLLVANVWGNQADLSMWPSGERPDHQEAGDQRSHMLIDRSPSIFHVLFHSGHPLERVDFILDNYGPELVHDLGLADFLLTTGTVKRIRFHARAHPTFVSDTLIPDIYQAADYLANHPDSHARALGSRVRQHLSSGRLELTTDFFWTSPLYFWEMPERIRYELSESQLLISKGDYNYRRLVGDRAWPPDTPFEDVVCYLPVPLVCLRVLKSEVVLGLQPGKAEALFREDPEWLINGRWGIIQFTP